MVLSIYLPLKNSARGVVNHHNTVVLPILQLDKNQHRAL